MILKLDDALAKYFFSIAIFTYFIYFVSDYMEGIPLPGEAPPSPGPPQLPIYIPLPASPPDLPPGCDLDDVEITYVSHTKKDKVSCVVYRLFGKLLKKNFSEWSW